ncbi:hypothetical protein AB0O28_10730 [Microbispora sp. NPDC088329]|uniref:hypothetical protein n=1 Tax=Microbispora sp. NPDC088329 TaxID=3154869 RepID=UPI00342FFB9D
MNELDLTYCEGWDPARKAAVGLLSKGAAAERDRRGEQYAVVVSAGRPWMVLEVAWGHGHWAVWLLDEQGRRTVKYDHRVLADDQIFLRHTREWRYDSAEQAEFDTGAWTRSRTFSPDGRCQEILKPKGERGGSRHTWTKADPGRLWFPMPVFGEWAFARRYHSGLSPAAAVRVTGAPDVPERVTPPWRPPAPLRPTWLDRMFRPGERFALPEMGEILMDVRPGPSLVMPHRQNDRGRSGMRRGRHRGVHRRGPPRARTRSAWPSPPSRTIPSTGAWPGSK